MDQSIARRSGGILSRLVGMTANGAQAKQYHLGLGAHRAPSRQRAANCNPIRPPYRRRAE
jgi:hypothetical protein